MEPAGELADQLAAWRTGRWSMSEGAYRMWPRTWEGGAGQPEDAMMHSVTELDGERYVGDTERKIVHDRWHKNCEGCMVEEIARRGAAVAFQPDELDSALMEDFEYCTYCFDDTEPSPPSR